MVLQGELYLYHEGHHSTMLKEFEQDSFRGDWRTTSRGRVTDFNLMMAQGCQGKLEAVSINRREYKEVLLTDNSCNEELKSHTEAFYIASGSLDMTAGNEKVNLSEGDLVLINVIGEDDKPEVKLHNLGDDEVRVIRVSILY
jgi:environmental stress-induced protein Ves